MSVNVLALLMMLGSASNGALTIDALSPGRVTLEFDPQSLDGPSIRVADLANGKAELYPLDASVEARAAAACPVDIVGNVLKLPAPGECDALLGPLRRREALKLAVSRPGLARYSVLEVIPPAAYTGKPTSIDVTDADSAAWPAIPKHVSLSSEDCWVYLDKWHSLKCTAAEITAEPHLAAVIRASWGNKQSLRLIMKVRDARSPPEGAWRAFPFQLAAPEKTQPPPKELDDLRTRCEAAVGDRAKEQDEFYAVCVDAHVNSRGIIALLCGGPAKKGEAEQPRFKEVGDLLRTNRSITVYVWHPDAMVAKISLGGVAGHSEQVHVPSGFAELKAFIEVPDLGATRQPPQQIETFGPRQAGSARLSLVTSTLATPPLVEEIARDFAIEDYFRFAIRLGVSMNSMPWARKVGARTSPDGQRFSEVIEGAQAGLFGTTLVAGFTYFFEEVRDKSVDVVGGFGVRLSVVGLSGPDVKVLDVLQVGFELCFGPDFSLGIFAGAARHDVPATGYEPGRLLPGDAVIPTQFALTPAFSVSLTFTPSFLKVLGVVK